VIGPILLAISWLLLFFEGKNLRAIGIDRPRRRFGEFALGFAFLGTAVVLQQFGLSLVAGDPFVRNRDLQPHTLIDALRAAVNSVLYEELVFRGYLLYRAIRLLGARRAVWLDAAAFGVYHWFSYNAFGNPIAMTYIFVLTGAYGYMWARAFAVTGSVAAPIGLHLGWNAVSYLVFSAGPLGRGLFVPSSGAERIAAGNWPSLVFNVLLPFVVTAIALWYCRRLERRAVTAAAPEFAR
jgi:membrane protease YdiL (CAAX protease family)